MEQKIARDWLTFFQVDLGCSFLKRISYRLEVNSTPKATKSPVGCFILAPKKQLQLVELRHGSFGTTTTQDTFEEKLNAIMQEKQQLSDVTVRAGTWKKLFLLEMMNNPHLLEKITLVN